MSEPAAKLELEQNATEVQATKGSQEQQLSDLRDADAMPPPSKKLKRSHADDIPGLVMEPVKRVQHVQHPADPSVQFIGTSSASDLAAKQLKALQVLHAIYQAEHKEVLEELRSTHQAFLAAGHHMLKQDAQPLHPAPPSCNTAAASMADILKAYRAQQHQPQQHGHAAPDSPTQGPTPQRKRDAVPGTSEASLGNWIAQSAVPHSSGTPQSGVRHESVGAPHAIGLTPVREEPCKPCTQQATDQDEQGAGTQAAQPEAAARAGEDTDAQADTSTMEAVSTQATATPGAAAQTTRTQEEASLVAGADTTANKSMSTAGEGAGGPAAASSQPDQPTTTAMPPPSAAAVKAGKAKEDEAAASVSTPQSRKPHASSVGAAKHAEPLARRLLVARALAACTAGAGEQHEDIGYFSEAEEALMTVVGTASISTEAASQPSEEQQQQQQPSSRVRFAACGLDKLLQLEALASAISEQELDDAGVLACLTCPTGRFLIRQSAVLLGRNTDSKGEVDVDLSLIDTAAKVSRRQAFLTLRPDGMWSLTNAGRQAVLVDGVAVEQLQTVSMQHLSMLEIGSLRLMLMVNSAAVERVLRRTARAAI